MGFAERMRDARAKEREVALKYGISLLLWGPREVDMSNAEWAYEGKFYGVSVSPIEQPASRFGLQPSWADVTVTVWHNPKEKVFNPVRTYYGYLPHRKLRRRVSGWRLFWESVGVLTPPEEYVTADKAVQRALKYVRALNDFVATAQTDGQAQAAADQEVDEAVS